MITAAVVFALGAGLLFGMTSHIQKAGLASTDDLTGTFISVATTAVVFWALAPFNISTDMWATKAALLFAASGLLFPAMGQRLQIASVVRIGPALTAAIGSLAPLFAIVPAVFFLGERLTLWATVGVGLLMASLVFAATANGANWRSRAVLFLLLPLGAAFVRGIVQPITKLGLSEVDSPFFATLVMTTVSTGVIAVLMFLRGNPGKFLAPTKGVYWFILNGLINGAGLLSLQYAISRGEISVVAPLVATAPLWTFLLGVLVFRNEVLGWRHAMVAVLVFVGLVLIVAR